MLSISSRLQIVAYIPTQLLPVKNYTAVIPPVGYTTGINFSQLCNGGEPLAVKGLIAVIECKAIAPGYANLKFQFTLGSTTDTNMAAQGQDILTKVVNKRITIL